MEFVGIVFNMETIIIKYKGKYYKTKKDNWKILRNFSYSGRELGIKRLIKMKSWEEVEVKELDKTKSWLDIDFDIRSLIE